MESAGVHQGHQNPVEQGGDQAVEATAAEQIRPTFIELIVLDGAKVLIPSYCKQLIMGGFDEAINQLRKQAKAL